MTPDALAVAEAGGGRSLTYGQLEREVGLLAGALLETGVRQAEPVGVCLPRSTDLVVALLAVWRAGACYVPLDPAHPAARSAAVLADTGARLVVTQREAALSAGGAPPAWEVPPAAAGVRTMSTAARATGPAGPAPAVSGDHPAYVLFTSGSTGTPKGVVVGHAGLANQVDWRVRTHGMGPGDRVLLKTPLTFDAAGWEVFAPLACGGTVVLAPLGAERDSALLVRTVAEERVTVLQVVPSLLRMLVDEPGLARCGDLRLLSSGGEQLHADLVRRFVRRMDERDDALDDADADGSAGAEGVETEVWNTYGPTECSNEVTGHRYDPLQRSGPVPIGRVVDGLRVLILDAEGREVPPGEQGELHLGGIGLAHGYVGRPDLTAERFLPDPYGLAGSRLYRTGDLGRLRPDGTFELVGRTDDQVKVNGVRIEPGEVEAALAAHPRLSECAVTAYRTAAGETRLAAYVRSPQGAAPRPAELREFLAGRLPETHLPAAFLEVDAFPRTASGKLDRRALPAPLPTGQPGRAPATDAERLVAEVWRGLLGVEQVGAQDDFFRLGGSSLQLMRLAGALRAATGRDVELADLLDATTVAAQALLIGAEGDPSQDARHTAGDPARRTPEGTASAAGTAMRSVGRTGPLPLSSGQRRLWLLEQLNPQGREWVTGVFLRVSATDDDALVQAALDELQARHESLRTRFAARGGGDPVQVIDAPGALDLAVLTAPRSGVGELVEHAARQGFDLARGPIARALLIRHPSAVAGGTPRDEATLVLLMHHIVSDGWSATILKQEFGVVLEALRAGRRPQLPELGVQYADFAVWQQQRLTDAFMARELAHWTSVLDGAAPLELWGDKPRPAARDARGDVVTFTVPAQVAGVLDELAQVRATTAFTVLLTAFATLLARYTGQWDVVIGTPVAGRERQETENVVGFFLNSLVLRCRLAGSLTFDEALRQVKTVCRDAFGHQELPFEQLVARLAPERDLSRTPLYQVAFDYHDALLTGSAADSAELDAVTQVSTVAKTDLTLYMRGQQDGSVVGALEYATSLFERATIERLAAHFQRLLATVASGPDIRLDALDFLLQDEHRELSRDAGSTGWHITASVPAQFTRVAARAGDAPALLADDGTLSFAELDARANRLARVLRQRGVGPESVVGVLHDRTVDLPLALLAVWRAGGAYLPLDPSFPADRIGRVLADAGAAAVIVQTQHRATLTQVYGGPLVATDGDAAEIAAESGAPLDHPAPLDPEHGGDLDLLAYVIYTSGSTGTPKGVQVTHRGLAGHIRWAVEELASRGGGGGALFSSLAFDLAIPNVWAPLLAGLPVRLLPQDLDLGELGARLDAAAPLSFLKLTPGHLDILAHQLAPERMARLAGAVVVAGEVLPVRLATQWASALGPERLINEYGPTEASVGTCTFPVSVPVTGESVPIGRPLPGMTMHVLDDRLGALPFGAVGELYVGGTGVARGYLGRSELTAECFVPDPHGPSGARLYRTGDLVRRLADGTVAFVGRRDGQVKIRGYRVETGEIENVLDEHPAVRDSVVVTVEDPNGTASLAAYWVPARDEPRDVGEAGRALAAYCAERLPEYMVPASFTPLAAVPLNANGKLDRAELPAPVQETDALVEPRNAVEKQVAELFEKLLGTPAGAHSHFFRSGGNSILAIRLIAELQDQFEIEFPARAVFEESTVAALAAVVEAEIRLEIARMSDDELRSQAGQ